MTIYKIGSMNMEPKKPKKLSLCTMQSSGNLFKHNYLICS